MMKNPFVPALAAAGGLFVHTLYATSIGLNFTDSADVAFAAATTAGAPGFEQANWNHFATDWSGEVVNDALFSAGLTDDTGANISGSVLLDVSYPGNADAAHFDAANTWRSGTGNTSSDHTLLNGYLDDGGNDQPYLNLRLAPGIYGTYHVVLYINGDGPTAGMGRYWLEEWTDSLTAGNPITDLVGVAASGGFSGTYTQAGGANFGSSATPVNQDVTGGHYLVFENISVRNLRIRGAGNGDPEDFGRGPLNAVQLIQAIPEPGSLGLCLMGLLLLRVCGCRRSRA